MSRTTLALVLAHALVARADDAAVTERAGDSADPLDLRLTLSSFLYRESGADAPALVDQGAPVENASPVRRYFGDLRIELSGEGLSLDARVRQTTSRRFQSGAGAGGEYDVRTASFQLGGERRALVLGRQYLDGLGGSKLDGLAFRQRLGRPLTATVFAGAFPVPGSRSLDTDYPELRMEDGTEGRRLIPIAAGLGLGVTTGGYHGDLGAAAVYVPQEAPMATAEERSRVIVAATGFYRAGTRAELHHFVLADIAGGSGAALSNGNVGATLHVTADVQLTGSVHHTSTDVLQIAARNALEDPDPSAIGIVQNNIAVLRVARDAARAGASVAMARRRFELSLSGGLHRRPEVAVELADGTGAVAFPEQRTADATLSLLDRRSLGGTRLAVSGTLTQPLRAGAPGLARGTALRASASRGFAQDRAQVEVDAMAGRFRTIGERGACTDSLDPLACYSASTTTLAQAGVLVTWRASREWLLLADVHLGYRTTDSTTLAGALAWPAVHTLSGYVRAQWRFR
ncbi:MAG: hypothetical protein JNL83_37785 [Myxococcales bacterium]|nr:hypothetical protein [Myxococcales bacterium]